jgi:hypothetical protein
VLLQARSPLHENRTKVWVTLHPPDHRRPQENPRPLPPPRTHPGALRVKVCLKLPRCITLRA